MDALTAWHLARELSGRWSGRRLLGVAFERGDRAVTVGVVGQEAVRFDLSLPDVPVRSVAAPALGALMSGWTVREVTAPEDDRRLLIHLARVGKFRGSPERTAVLELSTMPTARGAVLRDAAGRTLASVGARLPRAADPRLPLDDAAVRTAALAGDVATLAQGRWMSPRLAAWLAAEPASAVARYTEIAARTAAHPAWCDDRLVAYPTGPDARPADSLVAPAAEGTALPGRRSVAPAERAVQRMRAELERARAAPSVRAAAACLLELGTAPAPTSIVLPGGTSVETGATDGESAGNAARRLFATARSMERAMAALPQRIAARAARADATRDDSPREPPRKGGGARSAHPYKRYRSSGGLEIRVGRGAASNDHLTFHGTAGDEVWLHARDARGAHVVLGWRQDSAPPARDLEEAAALAAWHSKARGAALVPVDWTRRKYVRKPRGAAPGLVVLQQAATLFVRPDRELERSLRTDDPGD